MKALSFIVGIAVCFLAISPVRAATESDAAMTAKATILLQKIQAQVSAMRTAGLVDFTDFKRMPITGHSLRDGGWTTYYRYGDVRFRSRLGFGYDITPQIDSLAVLHSDSLYLGLTVSSPRDPSVASDNSFDLAPYLPGCRLYVFYRQNLWGQSYLSDTRLTPIEAKIYRIVAIQLADVNVRIPGRGSRLAAK
jgi:hypothetical protein